MDIGELTNPFKPKPQEEQKRHHHPEFFGHHHLHRHSTEPEVNPYQIGDYDGQPAAPAASSISPATTTASTVTIATFSSKESKITEETSSETIEVKCPEKNSVERLADLIKDEAHKAKDKITGAKCHQKD